MLSKVLNVSTLIYQARLPVVLAFVCLFTAPLSTALAASPTISQCRDFPTFPTDRTGWHEVLSASNSAVIATINNRPVSFDSRAIAGLEKELPKLEEALQYATTVVKSPRDIVECYCNLGCLNYLLRRYSSAHKLFERAVSEAAKATSASSICLAPILDFDGMSLRAAATETRNEDERHAYYMQADSVLLRSLQIRASRRGFYHADCAHSMMNLASLYHDRALDDSLESPSQRRMFSHQAHQLEHQAYDLMNPPNNRAASLLEEAFRYRQRSVALAKSDPDESWSCSEKTRQLIQESDLLRIRMTSVNSRGRSDLPDKTDDLSSTPPVPQQASTNLVTYTGVDRGRGMLSLANSVIMKGQQLQQLQYERERERRQKELEQQQARARAEKWKRQRESLAKVPHGLATIIGTWKVNSDLTYTAETRTSSKQELTLEGTRYRSGHLKSESNVASQRIYLLSDTQYSQLYRVLDSFGKYRGLSMDDFGHTWPANYQQSEQLMKMLESVASRIALSAAETDMHGDYEITGCSISTDNGKLPSGKYFLFASLLTDERCVFWFLPDFAKSIEVKESKQIQVDFTHENEFQVWRK
ncbi:MAG: hypothetical protein K2Y32_22865 [Candidatus Obscuribacterales bacterium]|nr:hypothetical protein [Candidatus Obscuribacterales bacterium]